MLLIVLGGAALVAILFVIGSSLEKAEPVGGLIAEEPSGISYIDRREVLEIGGKKYVEKQGQTSFLIVGIDKMSDQTDQAEVFRDGGQADFITVLIA